MEESFFESHFTTRQHQCKQENHVLVPEQQQQQQTSSLKLTSSTTTSLNTLSMLHTFVVLLFLLTSITPILSHPIVSVLSHSDSHSNANQTFRPDIELHKLRRIRAQLKKINKPPIKTIKAFIFLCFDLYNIFGCDKQ